jgi:hypothetical protein
MRLQSCVGSVCGGGMTLMCRGRDVYGWVRQLDSSPSTRRWSVEVYVSQVPHQGETVVFGYIEVSCERYVLNIHIGAYTHKYIGHEIANWWWGWGGRRSEHYRRCG